MGVLRYISRSEVTRYEEHRQFRFRVGGLADWEFMLESADGATLVTHRHRFEPPASLPFLLARPIIRVRARQNAANMARTLENLARLVGAPHPSHIEVSYAPPRLD